jgi:anti-anti-sigma factor
MTLGFTETTDQIIAYFDVPKILAESQIQQLGNGLLEFCDRAANKKKMLVVDFRGVQAISSAMIGKFVILNKMARQRDLRLKLVNVGADVFEVFKICRLDRVLRIGDDGDGPVGSRWALAR